MARYQMRPVFVEAEAFRPSRKPWPKGVEDPECYCVDLAQDGRRCELHNGTKRWRWKLRNGFRLLDVFPGDIIVTHADGNRSVMSPATFAITYVLADRRTGSPAVGGSRDA